MRDAMGESLKIALVHTTYSRGGGTERYVADLAEGLVAKGHEVHLFCASVREQPPSGVRLHRVSRVNLGGALKTLSFAARAQAMAGREEFDIVNGFGDIVRQDVLRLGGGCHREFRKKVLLFAETPLVRRIAARISPHQWTLMALERKRLRQGNYVRVVVNSRMVRDEIRRELAVPREAIRVIYNGVDLGRFDRRKFEAERAEIRRSAGVGEGDFAVLFLGSGYRRKGLATLLEACAAVFREEPRARLLVAGWDRKAAGYAARARELGLGEYVNFLGVTNEPERLYAAADLYVLPTRYDPFANTVLEAMASGLPVITTRTNGASEVIEEGVEGFVMDDARDTRRLASLILKCAPEETRNAMGARGRRKAEELPLERNLDETLEVYREVVELKRRSKGK